MEWISPAAQLDEALDRYAREIGLPALLAHVYAHFGKPLPTKRAMTDDDAKRHHRMAQLLTTDAELLERQRHGDRHLLSEAARRAIKESPRPTEIDPATGEPYPNVVKRLVNNFPYCSFDDPKRGFDQWKSGLGVLFSPKRQP